MRKKAVVGKNILIFVLVVALIATVPIGVKKVISVTPSLSVEARMDMAGIYGRITDRFGQTVFDGTVRHVDTFGNVIYGGSMMENVIFMKYKKELCPGKVHYLTGYKGLETTPRVMTTTLLSNESLQQILNCFGGKKGCCFAYNYKTGEVYVALSSPSCDPNQASPSYINRCFNSVYIPGSTMKFITSLIALDQGVNLRTLKHTCTGSVNLPDGNTVKCHGIHGPQTFSQGLANSCNSFFASIIMDLNLDKAINTLERFGFAVNEEGTPGSKIDRLSKSGSSANITNTATFKNVWSLIGQGNTLVNAVDMARIAGAVANGGSSATPYIVKSITNPNKNDKVIYKAKSESTEYMTEKVSKSMEYYWGVSTGYYHSNNRLPVGVTYAKTGTAEVNNGKSKNRALVGVIEEADTAFYIMIEDWTTGDPAMDIARCLEAILPKK